jgi:hypothetical protein
LSPEILWSPTAWAIDIAWPDLTEYSSKAYPVYRPLLDIVKAWSPDSPDISGRFEETLQHFNYSNPQEREMAAKYRDAEVPFKIYDIPDFNCVVQKWSDDEYLSSNLRGRHASHVELSSNNHFMFWKETGKRLENFVPPTEFVKNMNFDQVSP